MFSIQKFLVDSAGEIVDDTFEQFSNVPEGTTLIEEEVLVGNAATDRLEGLL